LIQQLVSQEQQVSGSLSEGWLDQDQKPLFSQALVHDCCNELIAPFDPILAIDEEFIQNVPENDEVKPYLETESRDLGQLGLADK